MGDLSEHFSRREFACKHCGAQKGPTTQLLAVLERLRAAVGRPLIVVSGYRCPAHNRAVGGASRSRHLEGDAADLQQGYARPSLAWRSGANGVGERGGWATHVDTRPGSRASWTYD